MSTSHHAISYIEFGTTDLPAIKDFYQAAFGWGFNDYGGEYAGIKDPSGAGEAGGFNPASTPGGNGPLVLIFSDDLDASLAAVRAAGGTIVAGPYAFPGGRRFEFTDPSGNRLGVYSDD